MSGKTCGTCALFLRDLTNIGICRAPAGYDEFDGVDAYIAVRADNDEGDSPCRGKSWIERANAVEQVVGDWRAWCLGFGLDPEPFVDRLNDLGVVAYG